MNPAPQLTLGPPDDRYEQEAERVASAVLRSPTGAPPSITPLGAQIRRSANGQPAIDQLTSAEIDRARGAGRPLTRRERDFFEPRFARDFAGVRIHEGSRTAALARAVGAEAFTVGRDIFFGGAPSPELMAHELAHTAQQSESTRLVQRAKIAYRAVTWADFKKSPPAGSPFEAETSSGFDIPNWATSQKAEETGKTCPKGTTADKEYKATAWVDPSIYDSIASFMDQDQSWVKSRRKDPKNYCTVTAPTECKAHFDQQAAQAKTGCAAEADSCRQAFKDGSTSYSVTINGVDIRVSSAEECGSKLAPECETASMSTVFYSLKDVQQKEYAKATSKADCSSKTFLASCEAQEAADSAKLLNHEQKHFDISNVLAPLAKADLQARAKAFKAEETACGKREAMQAAIDKASAFAKDLTTRGGDWVASKEKAQQDYDNDTGHGAKDAEQKTWEAKIAGGLKDYDLNAPKAPAGGATTTPATSTPQPGGGN